VLCDEVYEHLVFDGHEHVSLRSLPGMQDTAVRLGSAGKTFSFTGAARAPACCGSCTAASCASSCHIPLPALPGPCCPGLHALPDGHARRPPCPAGWKIGWVTGPAALVAPMVKAHQFMVFTVAPNLQHAVAFGLDKEEGFYTGTGRCGGCSWCRILCVSHQSMRGSEVGGDG
jgi:hypothetical protein